MKSNLTLIQFILKIQTKNKQEEGIGMLVTAVITTLIFVLMTTYLVTTGIGTKTTQASADLTNTFYSAESGLNTRIRELKAKFADGGKPTGTNTFGSINKNNPAANIAACFTSSVTAPTTNDYECRSKEITSTSSKLETGKNGAIGKSTSKDRYTNYTFVVDKTNYDLTGQPIVTTVPAGQNFGAMKVQEYVYTVYSTTTKQNPNAPQQPEAKTVLEMTVKNRVLPMFQFGAFYAGDLELGSSSNMVINGRVHTNGNLYVQPTSNVAGDTIYLQDSITAVGKIYNTIDSDQIGKWGIAQVLLTGDPNVYGAPNYQPFPTYVAPTTGEPPALTAAQIGTFKGKVIDGAAGITPITFPDPGTMRKRNYYTDQIGKYFGKADLRIEYVPDRAIPINVISIQQGSTNTQAKSCTTSLPASNTDPALDYIDVSRTGGLTAKCITFTKGQLNSLMQPVLLRSDINQIPALKTIEATYLTAGEAELPKSYTTAWSLPGTPGITTYKKEIIRGLVASVATTPKTLDYQIMNTHFDCGCYTDDGMLDHKTNAIYKDNYVSYLKTIPGLPPTDISNITNSSGNIIPETLIGAIFLPPPIQVIKKYISDLDGKGVAMNSGDAGFYDGRERRWVNVLQINLQSLAVWNRDGFYVEAEDQDLTKPYTPDPKAEAEAYASDNPANTSGNELVWKRAPINSTAPKGSLASLGLAALDQTEGGLIVYTGVNDDLNGDGIISASSDVIPSKTSPIYQKKADGSDYTDPSGNKVILDYLRQYKGNTASINKSPYAFAYTQGNDLPAPITLATDQSVYIQGDFNNFDGTVPKNANPTLAQISSDRKPASILADTITKLSSECIGYFSRITYTDDLDPSSINPLQIPASQINCGVPTPSTSPNTLYDKSGNVINMLKALSPTVLNAALMSNTSQSYGNAGRGYGTSNPVSSGGLENYVRLLEDWSTTYFTHTGSLVSLGTPLEYSGVWKKEGTGGYYRYPNGRQFNYDPNYSNVTKLPPLAPTATYLQQQVFKRRYD